MSPRSTALRGAALLAAAVVATGCGSGAESEPAAAENGTGTATAAGFPVTVSTAFGDVTVEEEPTRVVALGWSDAETALALDVQPVGASDWLGFGGEGVGRGPRAGTTRPRRSSRPSSRASRRSPPWSRT